MCPFNHGRCGWRPNAARICILAALTLSFPFGAGAGGSGLNALVVANQASSNSVELANYYRARRQLPPENLVRINWPGGNVEWSQSDFNSYLLNPLLAFLSSSGLASQIDYVVLSMDIPYRVTGSRANSTTSALFYGFKNGTKDLSNSYMGSEDRFREAPPDTAPGYSFLATMLTAGSLAQAKALVDQGVDSDATRAPQTAWLDKSNDPLRNRRYPAFDNAIFNTRLCEGYHLQRTNNGQPPPAAPLLGWQTGRATFSMPQNAFVPGAIADSLTSFGGKIFESSGQTTLLEFIHSGAAGSYGTVTEPQLDTKKFPAPMVYFYQSRGFSLAEAYYQSIEVPLEGLIVAEPLAAPYRSVLTGTWVAPQTDAVLQGTTNLCVYFNAGNTPLRFDRVDLFLNGSRHQTLTNVPPGPGNRLEVRINGYPIVYQVPPGASLGSIASGVTALLNQTTNRSYTEIMASAYGDRIELQSMASPLPSGTFEFVDAEAAVSESRHYLAVTDPYDLPTTIHPRGWTGESDFQFEVFENYGVAYRIEASTDLADWIPLQTNLLGGPMMYTDPDAGLHPRRFYRATRLGDRELPVLEALGPDTSNQFILAITASTNTPYIVQASTDLKEWSDVETNAAGGALIFTDSSSAALNRRYYRTRSADTNAYAAVNVMSQTPAGGNVVQVQSRLQGNTTVWVSTNTTDWFPIYTQDSTSGEAHVTTASDKGTNALATTHIKAAQTQFLKTQANGRQKFVLNNFQQPGAFLHLDITLTNETTQTIALTNTTLSNHDFVQAFAGMVNATAGLQGADGVVAEDVVDEAFGATSFNLRARASGLEASAVEVTAQVSPGADLSPLGMVRLQENIADLRPRNHLCIVAGVPSLEVPFTLDTTTLPDGFHELTAVAYEGTHVHSQTLVTVPVIVANSSLQATLALAEPGSTLPVTNTFDVVVTTNTGEAQQIQLFTTGGLYDSKTNQTAASFHIHGLDLGVGEHPFYALVTTTNGTTYRTSKITVTLVP